MELTVTRGNSAGYFYAFGASMALAASFIFSKSVLNNITLIQFGFVWFIMGIIWNGIWFIIRRDYRNLKVDLSKKLGIAISLAWIFLHVFPGYYQLIGGLLTLTGVWLITRDRSLFRK